MDGNAKVFAAQEALQQIKQLLGEPKLFAGFIKKLGEDYDPDAKQ